MSEDMIGPTLPPDWKTSRRDEEDIDDNEVFGPTLPTSEPQKRIQNRVIGPTLPALPEEYNQNKVNDNESDDDSDDMIGPIPPSHHNYDKYDQKFANCSDILMKSVVKNDERQQREEWMTEIGKPLASVIPTKSVKHFSQRPVKSVNKNDDKYVKRDEKRDKELSQLMDSFNKTQKRDVSLIDVHKKAKKAKTEEKEERDERVPFDREKDLSVRHMNSRETKSVLNKAKTFNTRFSLGINKFL